LAPIGSPARSLKDAFALRDLVISGFWPVILGEIGERRVHHLLVVTASPTPMLTVILLMRGTCITLSDLQIRGAGGNDLLAVVLLEPRRARALVSHAVRRRLSCLPPAHPPASRRACPPASACRRVCRLSLPATASDIEHLSVHLKKRTRLPSVSV